MTPQPPLNSITGIEALILFGLQVFTQVFSLFRHPTTPVPVTAAPAIINQLQSTPGVTEDHKTVISSAVNAAVTAHQSGV